MFDSWRDAYGCVCAKGRRSRIEAFSLCTLLDGEVELPHLVLADVLTQSVLGEWLYIGSYIGPFISCIQDYLMAYLFNLGKLRRIVQASHRTMI
jgi:hypothetical protein